MHNSRDIIQPVISPLLPGTAEDSLQYSKSIPLCGEGTVLLHVKTTRRDSVAHPIRKSMQKGK